MRKPSPIKMMTNALSAINTAKEAGMGVVKKKLADKKAAAATKPVEGKPASRPGSAKPKAKAEMASKVTPAMQLKKAGMKKKC